MYGVDVVLGLEVAHLSSAACRVPVLPLLLLLLVHLLDLGILVGEFEGFDLRLLAFLDVLRVVGQDLELVRHPELVKGVELYFFQFLILVFHGSQTV